MWRLIHVSTGLEMNVGHLVLYGDYDWEIDFKRDPSAKTNRGTLSLGTWEEPRVRRSTALVPPDHVGCAWEWTKLKNDQGEPLRIGDTVRHDGRGYRILHFDPDRNEVEARTIYTKPGETVPPIVFCRPGTLGFKPA